MLIELKYDFPWNDKQRRLRELILYIATKCVDDPNFGATKLNKILFYADFIAYMKWEKPVTGVRYMKGDFGPVPRALVPVRNEMVDLDEIEIQEVSRFNFKQKRPVAKREPDLSLFSAQEIALVDSIIDILRGFTGIQVSELTHNRAWRIADKGQDIPYQAVFLSDDDVAESDVVRAAELSREHGWERY